MLVLLSLIALPRQALAQSPTLNLRASVNIPPVVQVEPETAEITFDKSPLDKGGRRYSTRATILSHFGNDVHSVDLLVSDAPSGLEVSLDDGATWHELSEPLTVVDSAPRGIHSDAVSLRYRLPAAAAVDRIETAFRGYMP